MRLLASFEKKAALVFSAGLLLQTTSCTTDDLLTFILQSVVADFVFGALGVPIRI